MFSMFENKKEKEKPRESIVSTEAEFRVYVKKDSVKKHEELDVLVANGYKVNNADVYPYVELSGIPLLGLKDDLKEIMQSCVYEEKFTTNNEMKLGRFEMDNGATKGLLEKKGDRYHLSVEGDDVGKVEAMRVAIRSGKLTPKFEHET